jgi:hypothetical protein
MNETRILITLLQMYIPRNWEFGSALAKLQNFGEVFNPPFSTPLVSSAQNLLKRPIKSLGFMNMYNQPSFWYFLINFIHFLISDFRRVLKLVCFLLGISPASD